MDREKRKGSIPIPDHLKELLNDAQLKALSGMKYSGWELRFLRRPLFQEPVLVVHNSIDGRIGVLDKDGSIRIQANIKVRELESLTQTPPSSNPLVWTK
jgi:hypothetical protein